MSNVIKFKLHGRASRKQALNWLVQSRSKFPHITDAQPILAAAFHDWRFVLGMDGNVYFANCIEPGITEAEFIYFKKASA